MNRNPVSHRRAKHIDLHYHFVRELVIYGKLYTKFIPTKLQLGDSIGGYLIFSPRVYRSHSMSIFDPNYVLVHQSA